ncbi:MAG: hypothetical protein FP825_13485 [Hyphomonas sp.]|uniref:hypothetical protein n=1 Tax=Hyphomonas sp. TaxID=87 RepID=UPI00179DE78F|nr:hypothetical protein [Hyphomonas sp.]MBA3069478.1 hypothetical protein [Hyphomonas sp.]MBU3921502.1 hypothetical protein [Alphaproteobacteria bacterium]MBU4063860.1 hypothetical protein [Alphaproteobacteria bacterium]MBU4164179.1 hypothetical protein [Alphaproteobacteria bacterium]
MTDTINAIVDKIQALELELEGEFAKQRAGLRYGLEHGKVLFEEEVVRRHRELRLGLARYLLNARPLVALSAPVIYSLIIPFAIVDAWVSIYQAICFRVYGIPQVPRGRYMVFDRAGLRYLNALEKINCAYCSYVNGVIGYVREVGSRTEQYWCPIKHARRILGAHARYHGFEEYGHGEDYRAKLHSLRAKLASEPDEPPPKDGV